jgi:DNA-binding NtrC family response regulator
MNKEKVILLIDDEKNTLDTLEAILDQRGHKVLLANNLQLAKKLIADYAIDIIFCDIKFPNENGLNFLEWNSKNNNIPTVIMTGQAGVLLKKEIESLGGTGLLTKPFCYDQMEEYINN